MKRINLKLLIILFASTLAFLVGFYFLHDYQARRRADGLLVLADQKQQAEDYESEAKIRVSYLGRRPDDVEQYGYVAKAYTNLLEQQLELGKFRPEVFQRAFAFYEQAIRRAPENTDLRKAAIEFYMRLQRHTDAVAHLEYLQAQQGQLDPELEAQLALCYLRGGQEDRAEDLLSKMLGFDQVSRQFDEEAGRAPDSIEAHQLLASMYNNDGRNDIAMSILDHLVERNSESARAYLVRGEQRARTDQEAARDDFEKALQLDGEDEQILLRSGAAALEASRKAAEGVTDPQQTQAVMAAELAKARERFEKCLELFPNSVGAMRGLAQTAMFNRNFDEAIAYLDQAVEAAPHNTDLLIERTEHLLNYGKLEQAEEGIEKLRGISVPRFVRDYLSGRLHEARGEWLEAVAKFTEARPFFEQQLPHMLPQVDLRLMIGHQKLNNHDQSLSAIDRLINHEPTNFRYHWYRLETQLALNQIDQALEEYAFIEANMASELEQLTASSEAVLLRHFQVELAQQERLPKDRRNFTQAEAMAKRVIAADELQIAVKTTTVASYFQLIGQEEKAKELIAKLEASVPNNLALKLRQIKQRGHQEDGLEAALGELDQLVEQHGDIIAFRLLRAELLAVRRPPEFEAQLQALAENTDAYADADKALLWTELGRYQMAVEDFDAALDLWMRAKGVAGNDLDIQMNIVEVAMMSGDDAAILQAENDLRAIAGEDSTELKWARAVRILHEVRNDANARPADNQARLVNAQGLIDEAIERRPHWEQLYRVKGEIAAMQGQPEVAVAAFQKAIDTGSTNLLVHRRLARLYYTSERFPEALAVLEKLPRSSWTPTEQRIQLDILSRQGQLPEEVPYDKQSTESSDHLFIGQLFAKAGRFEEAEEALQRAVDLDPAAAAPWNALVHYWTLKRQPDQARKVIEEASTKVSEDMRAQFLASAYSLLEDWEPAVLYSKQSVELYPEDLNLKMGLALAHLNARQIPEAQAVLQEIIDTDSGDMSPPIVALARRKLAEVTATSGTFEDYQKAMALLEQNKQRLGRSSDEDLLLEAVIAARQPDQAIRRATLDKLEEVRRTRNLHDRILLSMADLHYGLNEWSDAQSLMLDLLSRSPKDQLLVEKWLNWLVARGDLRQAASWVDNASPRSTVSIRTKALIDASSGRSERAIGALKALIPQPLNAQTLPQMKALGLLLEEVGKYDPAAYDEAESVFKQYVNADRERMLELALHYKRRGDPSRVIDGFKVCQLAVNAGQGSLAIQTAMDLLRAYRSQLDDSARYEDLIAKWLDAELAKTPESGTLYIQRSELEDLRGNSEEAISWMRRFLEKEDTVPFQRALVSNNLAFKLALKGKSDEAQPLLDEAIRFFGPRAEVRDTQGVIHYFSDDFTQAVEEFTKALQQGTPTAATYVHLALAKYEVDDKVGAESALRSAQALGLDLSTLTKIERDLVDKVVKALKDDGLMVEPEAPAIDQQAQSVAP